MEFASTWTNLSGQGFMFWAANAAVGLGITLILVAGIIQVRRFRSRTMKLRGVPCPVPPQALEQGAETGSEQSLNSDHQNMEVEKPLRSPLTNSSELVLLLARLRLAADQLEEFHHVHRNHPCHDAESPLKEHPAGVDYLFRTGTG